MVAVNQQVGDNAFTVKDVDLYQLAGNQGDVLTVSEDRQAPGTLYAYLRVFDAAGNQLAIDYGSGPNSTSRIIGLRLPATGTYYVGVSSVRALGLRPEGGRQRHGRARTRGATG